MLLLSDLLGSDVHGPGGGVVGHLVDLAVRPERPGGADHPAVSRLAVGRGRRVRGWVAWTAVRSFEHDRVEITEPLSPAGTPGGTVAADGGELLLRRDVLDTQVIDVAGKRLARVADVLLDRDPAGPGEPVLRVMAVDVGSAGVWRRLGIDRLAERAAEQPVDWADLHLTSERGHALQLAGPSATAPALERLPAAEVASAVSHLPPARAARVLDSVPVAVAARALGAAHPRVGARLLRAVAPETAAKVMAHLAADDAVALLRGVPAEAVEPLLAGVHSERAATLRRLLAHPAGTAGGLMDTEVHTARPGEPVAIVRARLAADIPELEGLATVFVVDEAGRPLGSWEPIDLLAGRPEPRPVPAVPAADPVEQVIDLFALNDYLAVPVVDTAGRLVGVITIDDVMAELLAERLPGRARFDRIRRRGGGR